MRRIRWLTFPLLVWLPLLPGCAGASEDADRETPPAPMLEPQVSGTTASLRGLSVLSPQVAWASGSEGVFLRTVDGGKTWTAATVPGAESLDFRDVEALDEKTALLLSVGHPAHLFKTEDGGQSWREVYRNESKGVFFDAMAFWDRRRGIAFSDPVDGAFLVIITEDGGETWKTVPAANLPAPRPYEAGFAASGTSLAVQGQSNVWFGTGGGAARVFRSRDGGWTWSAADTPLQSGNPSQGIFSIAFRDANHGVIVGGDYRNPINPAANAAVTSDGGATWTAVEGSAPPRGYRSSLAWTGAPEAPVLVAAGPSGCDYSLDGGWTWLPIRGEGYNAIGFSGAAGWAAGSSGRVARLTFYSHR